MKRIIWRCSKITLWWQGNCTKKLPRGVLARCLSLDESTKRLKEVHEKSCGSSGFVNLYRCLQQLGYYWPKMSKQAATVQEQCTNYQYAFDKMESCAVFTTSDWRIPFLEYLIEGILPDNHKEANRLKNWLLVILWKEVFFSGRGSIGSLWDV